MAWSMSPQMSSRLRLIILIHPLGFSLWVAIVARWPPAAPDLGFPGSEPGQGEGFAHSLGQRSGSDRHWTELDPMPTPVPKSSPQYHGTLTGWVWFNAPPLELVLKSTSFPPNPWTQDGVCQNKSPVTRRREKGSWGHERPLFYLKMGSSYSGVTDGDKEKILEELGKSLGGLSVRVGKVLCEHRYSQTLSRGFW